MRIVYKYGEASVRLLSIEKVGSKTTIIPQDEVEGGVYFVNRTSNVTTGNYDEEAVSEETEENVDIISTYNEIVNDGLSEVIKDISGNIIVSMSNRLHKRNAEMRIDAIVPPGLWLTTRLLGGHEHSPPSLQFCVIDKIGVKTIPEIKPTTNPGATMYDGITGGIGKSVERLENTFVYDRIVKKKEELKDRRIVRAPIIGFMTMVRAISIEEEKITPMFWTRRFCMYVADPPHDNWKIEIGPDKDVAIAYPDIHDIKS